ncbi:hypothetical protein [Tenacibaculum finnmarkense]|uniref:hypothetical protein n=1 Tax=Tenacibaculum finnmarkense TaxID=2781243 RepID=UPI003BB553D5
MIYLFEDRKERMKSLLKDKKELDKRLIDCTKIIDCSIDDLDTYFKSLDKLEGVMIHKSYSFKDKKITIPEIEDIVKKKMEKFIVKFSGGVNDVVIDERNEIVINSGTFYNNLGLFLESYSEHKIILPLLVFGKEGYVKNQLKQFQNTSVLEILTNQDVKLGIKKTRNNLSSYIKSNELKNRKEKFEEWLGKKFKDDSLSKEKLISAVNRFCNYEGY